MLVLDPMIFPLQSLPIVPLLLLVEFPNLASQMDATMNISASSPIHPNLIAHSFTRSTLFAWASSRFPEPSAGHDHSYFQVQIFGEKHRIFEHSLKQHQE